MQPHARLFLPPCLPFQPPYCLSVSNLACLFLFFSCIFTPPGLSFYAPLLDFTPLACLCPLHPFAGFFLHHLPLIPDDECTYTATFL